LRFRVVAIESGEKIATGRDAAGTFPVHIETDVIIVRRGHCPLANCRGRAIYGAEVFIGG
jgi:hypothetical protein